MNLAFLERRLGHYERALELYESAVERVSDVSLGIINGLAVGRDEVGGRSW